MAKIKLTQDYLKECLTYNIEAGIFIWNKRPLTHFKNSHGCNIWNSRWSKKEAGSIDKKTGYFRVCINSKLYSAHRLAFLYMEGYLPENDVDHKDKNGLNNKWSNLREVSTRCNLQNCNISKSNKSGVTGVYFDKSRNKWVAQITINYKAKTLGLFDNFEDAVWARYNEEVNNPLWTCSVSSTALKYIQENNLI